MCVIVQGTALGDPDCRRKSVNVHGCRSLRTDGDEIGHGVQDSASMYMETREGTLMV